MNYFLQNIEFKTLNIDSQISEKPLKNYSFKL